MTSLQVVYQKFEELDNKAPWTKLDDQMSHLDYLEDLQVCIEADVIYEEHKSGKPRCPNDHPKEQCLVPHILEAVDIILDIYREYGEITLRDRQALQYYIVLSYLGDIIS